MNTFHSDLKLRPDLWNHVSVRVNKTGVTFDVNDQRKSIVDDVTFAGSSNTVSIGDNRGWNANQNLVGAIDDVAIYDRRVGDVTMDKYLSSYQILNIKPSTFSDTSEHQADVVVGDTITRVHFNNKMVFDGQNRSMISVDHSDYDKISLHDGWTFTTFIDPTSEGLVKGPILEKNVTSGPKIHVGVSEEGKIYVNL